MRGAIGAQQLPAKLAFAGWRARACSAARWVIAARGGGGGADGGKGGGGSDGGSGGGGRGGTSGGLEGSGIKVGEGNRRVLRGGGGSKSDRAWQCGRAGNLLFVKFVVLFVFCGPTQTPDGGMYERYHTAICITRLSIL